MVKFNGRAHRYVHSTVTYYYIWKLTEWSWNQVAIWQVGVSEDPLLKFNPWVGKKKWCAYSFYKHGHIICIWFQNQCKVTAHWLHTVFSSHWRSNRIKSPGITSGLQISPWKMLLIHACLTLDLENRTQRVGVAYAEAAQKWFQRIPQHAYNKYLNIIPKPDLSILLLMFTQIK